MVIVRYSCGLGNQLFQYAAARATAQRLAAPLACDLRWFDGANRRRGRQDRRDYLLPQLGWDLPAEPARTVEGFYPKWWWRWTRRRPAGRLIRQVDGDPRVGEFFAAAGTVCLQGYWQGEVFFEPVKEEIGAHLGALRPAGAVNAPWLDALAAPGAVAVHVRRGDYAGSRSPRRLLGPLEPDYYQSALAGLGATHAVVFSDEIGWCRENFRPGLPVTWVEPAGPLTDEWLCLAQARALVTANSTFSWWAAWIAARRGARVVAPARWFADRNYAEWERLLKVPGWTWI